MNVNTESTLGFGHFIAQSDAVGKTLLAVLVAMSVLSWIIIAIKGLTLAVRRKRSASFLNFFWNATSLDAVAHAIRDKFTGKVAEGNVAAAAEAFDYVAKDMKELAHAAAD